MRKAAAQEARTAQLQYGLGGCGGKSNPPLSNPAAACVMERIFPDRLLVVIDPLTPRPAPHSVWLNTPEVRAALHATLPVHPWGQRIGWDYTRTVSSVLEDVWPDLISRYTSVIYSGDTDACVP